MISGLRSSQVGSRCDSSFVQLFDSYEAAYRTYGPPAWQYVGSFGHDREVYLATVYGAFPFCPKTTAATPCPLYRDHMNFVIDAVTGDPT